MTEKDEVSRLIAEELAKPKKTPAEFLRERALRAMGKTGLGSRTLAIDSFIPRSTLRDKLEDKHRAEALTGQRLEYSNAIVDGIPQKVLVTPYKNSRYGAAPMIFDERQDPPARSDPPPPQGPQIGEYAKEFVERVDWETRTIHFKNKRCNVVTVPAHSKDAWKIMKDVITSTKPDGLADLDHLDRSWTTAFDRKPYKVCKRKGGEKRLLDSYRPLKQLQYRLELGPRGTHTIRLKKFDWDGYREELKKAKVPLK